MLYLVVIWLQWSQLHLIIMKGILLQRVAALLLKFTYSVVMRLRRDGMSVAVCSQFGIGLGLKILFHFWWDKGVGVVFTRVGSLRPLLDLLEHFCFVQVDYLLPLLFNVLSWLGIVHLTEDSINVLSLWIAKVQVCLLSIQKVISHFKVLFDDSQHKGSH